MKNKLYIFESNGGYGPIVHAEASNEAEAYEKARETLTSLGMPFEVKLIEVRDEYINKEN